MSIEQKHLVDEPLWLLGQFLKKSGNLWEDTEGYLYRIGHRVPDKVDMTILLYMLLKSQEEGYKKSLSFTKYQIIKSCGLPINEKSYLRLEDSLECWLNISIKFDEANGSMGFHILDSYKVDKTKKTLEIRFNSIWLSKIEKSRFTNHFAFDYHKALKRTLSRKLFKALSKHLEENGEWEIDLVKLGVELEIPKRKVVRKGGKEEKVLYHSDVLAKLRPAINEFNKMMEDQEVVEEIGLKENFIFSVDYSLKEKNKTIIFTTKRPTWLWVKEEKERLNLFFKSIPEEEREEIFEEAVNFYKPYSSPKKKVPEIMIMFKASEIYHDRKENENAPTKHQ